MAYFDVWKTDHLRPKVGPDVRVERIAIPSRDPGRTITAYLYIPVDIDLKHKQPVHVNVHGSGFTIKAFFGNSRYFCYLLASRLKCIVIDTDYRKAPEYPFPFPIRDVEDCFAWVFAQPQRFDTTRVTTSGFSAGGNLTMSAASELGPEKIKAIITFYPPFDATTPGAFRGLRATPEKEFRSGVHLISWVFSTFFFSYISPRASRADPRISVAKLPLTCWPNHMLIVCGRADVMFLDSQDFYNKIQAEGSAEQRLCSRFIGVPGEAHAFDEQPNCPESIKWRDTTYEAAIETIRAAWTQELGPKAVAEARE
ncbi:hypothetical protein MVES1_002115 [Malassezia vespertilionis]|uniref:Alpha/beta hydrolase fold-3 domain-containing protein n=1 Tax=Malassezia vespertilionis TaxID=2020962 RepID=A0A2N1JBI1_9BASI|nr:uncharacterized protein MVES1_002115 [Malassezia vespertilionis]PKI83909.1 hypothetical protein MVES_001996 [Malassezia vespertilionis]WFD06761.1 hypothetical protein MVES1_002115 [Malassezia vespertilionis]